MYRVLVPVDRKRDRAVHQAKYVERLAEAGEEVEATVLYVVSSDESGDASAVDFTATDAAVDAAELLEEAGVTVQRTVEDGPVSAAIVQFADDLDVDEVVMGGRKRSGVTQVLLGSIVHDVLLSTDRAVTVTGEETLLGDGMRKVLVPVSDDPYRALHQAEHVAALPNASESVEATVLYVYRHQDYKGAPPHDFEEIDAAVKAAEHLEEAGVSVERVTVGGEIAEEILDVAEASNTDGIVMGGRKRSGIQEVLLGSVTTDVMLSAKRPVTLTG